MIATSLRSRPTSRRSNPEGSAFPMSARARLSRQANKMLIKRLFLPFMVLSSWSMAGCWDFGLFEVDTSAVSTDTPSDEPGDTAPGDTDTDNPCNEKVCDTPSAKGECDPSGRIIRQAANGYCVVEDGNAVCKYPTYTEECLAGECEDGTCPDSPLQGMICNDPPEPKCDGDKEIISYYPIGVATFNPDGEPTCEYTEYHLTCENGCKNRRCVREPCVGVFCSTPPAPYCSDRDNARMYTILGRCNDDGTCRYGSVSAASYWASAAEACEKHQETSDMTCKGDYSERHESEVDDMCKSGAPDEEALCLVATCLTPPADFCLDGQTLYSYEHRGYCKDGACIYRGEEIVCRDSCRGGRCTGDEACNGVSYILSPAPRCDAGGVMRVLYSPPPGEPSCDHGAPIVSEWKACDKTLSCINGECSQSACSGVQSVCRQLSPQASFCTENQVVSHQSTTACISQSFCEFFVTTEPCESCVDDTCEY